MKVSGNATRQCEARLPLRRLEATLAIPSVMEQMLSGADGTTRYIVFLVIAAVAPPASMIGNLPISITRGTGAGVHVDFLIAGAII